jgi:hypothetical protein
MRTKFLLKTEREETTWETDLSVGGRIILKCKIWGSKAVTMKNVVFCDVALCRSCVNWRFGGTYSLHLQDRKIRERWTSVSRWLRAILSSETSVDARSTQRHIPEDILHILSFFVMEGPCFLWARNLVLKYYSEELHISNGYCSNKYKFTSLHRDLTPTQSHIYIYVTYL